MNNQLSLQRGASMVEVLVTVFILAIGLLGVAGLQSTGLRQTTMSQMGAHAQLLTQDLAEMILAFDSDADGTYEFASVPNAQGKDCTTNACTKAELAQYNVWLWAENMEPELPGYALQIDFTPLTSTYEIMLTWDEEREGASYTASTCTAADGLNPGCFAMLLEISNS